MTKTHHDPAHSTVPLDTEDGGQVVIEQENAGPGNQVGGGEFKNAPQGKTPEEAAREQERLEREAPIDDTSSKTPPDQQPVDENADPGRPHGDEHPWARRTALPS